MCKVPLILRILGRASNTCRNYGPSNLFFCFSDSCMVHLNKTQTEIAVMLTLPVFESNTKMKTLWKNQRFWSILCKMAVL